MVFYVADVNTADLWRVLHTKREVPAASGDIDPTTDRQDIS